MDFSHICHPINESTILIVSKPKENFAFRGRVTLQVLSGNLNIFGYKINHKSREFPILQSAAHSAHLINVLEQTGSFNRQKLQTTLSNLNLDETRIKKVLILAKKYCIVLLKAYKYTLTNCLINNFPKLFNPRRSEYEMDYGQNEEGNIDFVRFLGTDLATVLRFPQHWMDLSDRIQEEYLKDFKLRILVCGGKGCGKSTVISYLINSLLNECDGVYHMDCDPGQPEFTPSGVLSLNEIAQPIFESSFLHQQTPLCSYFAGGVNPIPFAHHYVKCIQKLHKSYLSHEQNSPKPLLINTMGCIKGVGLQLLFDVISITQPTHIVQIGGKTAFNIKPLTLEHLSTVSGLATSLADRLPKYEHVFLESCATYTDLLYKSPYLRSLRMHSYLTQLCDSSSQLLMLNTFQPFIVSWSHVALFCCNLAVPNHEILYAMNGSLVALSHTSQFKLLPTLDSTLPKFLNEMPDGEWIGYGVIRGIDMIAKTFYVVSPVSQEHLRKVNVFIKSEIDLSDELIFNQKTKIPAPYITCKEGKKTLIGSKSVEKRTFRIRGGHVK